MLYVTEDSHLWFEDLGRCTYYPSAPLLLAPYACFHQPLRHRPGIGIVEGIKMEGTWDDSDASLLPTFTLTPNP